jgi:hypothetical protein
LSQRAEATALTRAISAGQSHARTESKYRAEI